jgi:hypothetical protein
MNPLEKLPTHCVRARRFFYGPKEECTIAFVGTLDGCRAFIDADNREVYRTSNGESGRWRLKIVRTNSLRPYALLDAKRKLLEQDWR